MTLITLVTLMTPMTPRKYTPPVNVRKEPETRQEIEDEIDHLKSQLTGGGLDAALKSRIEELRSKLIQ